VKGRLLHSLAEKKNSDSVVPSATPSFLLEDVAILFVLMAENRNSCHEITPRDCHMHCHSVQSIYLPLSCYSLNIKIPVNGLSFCRVFVFLFKGVTWIEEQTTSVIKNFSRYEDIPIEGGEIFRV
jgi:hypothetical protein